VDITQLNQDIIFFTSIGDIITIGILISVISQTPKYNQNIFNFNMTSLWLFGFICAQNSISSLVLYNRLNSIKSPWLFHFIWVKIHSYLYLFLLPNYLLHKITWTLCRVFSFPNLNFYIVFYYWNTHSEICFNYSFYYFMYLRLVITF